MRIYKEDDHYFGAWNAQIKGQVDWTPFHSAEEVQEMKPRMTSKSLPALSSTSKLVPKETRSDPEDHRRVELMGGDDARGLVKTEAAPINHFMQWFQAISANMNAEAQKRALSASRKAASSMFADEGDYEGNLNVIEAAPVQSDLRRVEYSAEMAEVGFPLQSQHQRDSPREQQH